MNPHESCLIFDYDLTLVDLRLDRQVMIDHLAHGCEALGLCRKAGSWTSSFYVYRDIVDRRLWGSPERETVKRLLDDCMAAGEWEALPRARPLPGSRDALEELRGRGFAIGVVSSNSVRVLEATSRRFRLRRFLDSLWGRESPGRSKPAPDKLLGCLEELGFRRGIYIGDDPTDMDAASSAGLHGIGVLRSTDRLPTPSVGEMRRRGATRVVESLVELPRAIDSIT